MPHVNPIYFYKDIYNITGDLQIVKVNLQKNENEEAHRTKQYAIDSLVVRRGQSFEIELELNENYIQNKQNIILELMSGTKK